MRSARAGGSNRDLRATLDSPASGATGRSVRVRFHVVHQQLLCACPWADRSNAAVVLMTPTPAPSRTPLLALLRAVGHVEGEPWRPACPRHPHLPAGRARPDCGQGAWDLPAEELLVLAAA